MHVSYHEKKEEEEKEKRKKKKEKEEKKGKRKHWYREFSKTVPCFVSPRCSGAGEIKEACF